MNSLRILVLRLGVAILVTATLSLLQTVPASSDGQPAIESVAVDANVSGNGPTWIGTVEACRVATVGSVFSLDIVVDEVPPFDPFNSTGTIFGFGFNLVYNPSVLSIIARDDGSSVVFHQNPPLGIYWDALSDILPDSDGDYRQDAGDLGGPNNEYGEGVLARLTIMVVGTGVSPLDLNDSIQLDGAPEIVPGIGLGEPYPITNVHDGEIRADGSSCDIDGDGIQNLEDNCPAVRNPSQADQNGDDIGDACDSVGGTVLISDRNGGEGGLPATLVAGAAALLAISLTASFRRFRLR